MFWPNQYKGILFRFFEDFRIIASTELDAHIFWLSIQHIALLALSWPAFVSHLNSETTFAAPHLRMLAKPSSSAPSRRQFLGSRFDFSLL